MKKKVVIMIGIIIVMVLGAYLAFVKIFPRALPIQLPPIGSISSISLSTNEHENTKAEIPQDEFPKILAVINKARPTRAMSVNDYPTVTPYYTIELSCGESTIRYFVYEERGKAYLEIPYEGIYHINKEDLSVLSGYVPTK